MASARSAENLYIYIYIYIYIYVYILRYIYIYIYIYVYIYIHMNIIYCVRYTCKLFHIYIPVAILL
jgi:hypothetical protein